jgi:hypothetical protein
MKNDFYVSYLMRLPAGFEKFVGEILMEHRGQELAIPRRRLVSMVASKFRDVREIDRMVRRAIEKLREDGWLIGMSHSGDGYYLITSQQEYDDFRAAYTKRAYTVLENAKRMDESAKRIFGSMQDDPKQLSLIG